METDHRARPVGFVSSNAAQRYDVLDACLSSGACDRVADPILETAIVVRCRIRGDHDVCGFRAFECLGERFSISYITGKNLGAFSRQSLKMSRVPAKSADLSSLREKSFCDDVSSISACS